MSLTTHFKCAGLSATGRVRENNEDRVCADAERGFFAVVDGMGGHAAGEEAAETALRVLSARLGRQTGDPEARVREAIALANNEIYRRALNNEEWSGMACVMTVAVVAGDVAYVGHVGDTRLYRLTPSGIVKVTRDHSPVGLLEDLGALGEQEAMSHPQRNEVFRDVGAREHDPEDADFIDTLLIPFTPDCALLLCSDGLSDMVTSSEMFAVVARHAGDEERVVSELIEAANAAGGRDNVSAVYVEGADFARSLRESSPPEPSQEPAPETPREVAPPPLAEPAARAARRWVRLGVGLLLILAGILLGVALTLAWQRWMARVEGHGARGPWVARGNHEAELSASNFFRPAVSGVTHGVTERFVRT